MIIAALWRRSQALRLPTIIEGSSDTHILDVCDAVDRSSTQSSSSSCLLGERQRSPTATILYSTAQYSSTVPLQPRTEIRASFQPNRICDQMQKAQAQTQATRRSRLNGSDGRRPRLKLARLPSPGSGGCWPSCWRGWRAIIMGNNPNNNR